MTCELKEDSVCLSGCLFARFASQAFNTVNHQEGLLLGTHYKKDNRDNQTNDNASPSSSNHQEIILQNMRTFHTNFTFYDKFDCQSVLEQTSGVESSYIGWYIIHRNTKLTISAREKAIARKLLKMQSGSGTKLLTHCLVLLLISPSSKTKKNSAQLLTYKCAVFKQGGSDDLSTVKLNVINLGGAHVEPSVYLNHSRLLGGSSNLESANLKCIEEKYRHSSNSSSQVDTVSGIAQGSVDSMRRACTELVEEREKRAKNEQTLKELLVKKIEQ